MAVTIPEEPGSFKKFCALLGTKSITEFNYRYADPKEAHVFVAVSVRDRAEAAKLIKSLEKSGLHTVDLTDNEMAKLHVRHLVGGRIDQLSAVPMREKCYNCVSTLNRRHMPWAWMSLFSVGFTDFYIRMCSMGIFTDPRIL